MNQPCGKAEVQNIGFHELTSAPSNLLLALPVLHFSCFDAAELLDRPVESLLMNQADHFRETQEERELLNQVMPLINTGYVRS